MRRLDMDEQKRLLYLHNHRKNHKLTFIECPFCGYNNEETRFSFFGTCLRCHKVVDKKIYIKRLLYEARNKYKMKG